MTQSLKIKAVRKTSPLIHCITNPISINQCANALLALGARPIMAEHPREVAEITSTASSLMLNLGNITDARMESIAISAETAARKNIPFVLDLVGVSCSAMRRELAKDIISRFRPTVIKGNYSEIRAFSDDGYSSAGVDAESSLTTRETAKNASELARRYGCAVLASGKDDIVADGNRTLLIKNGCESLSHVTGTGCMLGAICACFLSVSEPFSAAAAACAVLGICGELSVTEKGAGSFFVNLMDRLSTISDGELEKYIRTEEVRL